MKKILWTSDLQINGLDKSEKKELINKNAQKFENLLKKLDIRVSSHIIGIANISIWNSRTLGAKDLGTEIKNCLIDTTNPIEFFIENNELRAREKTLDNTYNDYYFRRLKPEVDPNSFINLFKNGDINENIIRENTKSIIPDIQSLFEIV